MRERSSYGRFATDPRRMSTPAMSPPHVSDRDGILVSTRPSLRRVSAGRDSTGELREKHMGPRGSSS